MLALPPSRTVGFDSLFTRLAFYLADAFERSDALARDGLELGPEFGHVIGDQFGAVARPADLDV